MKLSQHSQYFVIQKYHIMVTFIHTIGLEIIKKHRKYNLYMIYNERDRKKVDKNANQI